MIARKMQIYFQYYNIVSSIDSLELSDAFLETSDTYFEWNIPKRASLKCCPAKRYMGRLKEALMTCKKSSIYIISQKQFCLSDTIISQLAPSRTHI